MEGGEFLIRSGEASQVFTPEAFSEEQRLIASSCRDFYNKEVAPHVEDLESMKEGLMPGLLEKAGALDMLGISVDQSYGGLGLSFTTSLLATEALGEGGSFSTAFGAHTGIGTLPILYYGSKEQKEKYLPQIVSGKWKSCYCLSEPQAGSDANAGKTKARLSEDGKSYLLNGQKMWISNGGFADVLIVFAKIEDDKDLSAFIVKRDYPGITFNEEEKKMGLKGSSTRQIFFNDCQVPAENLLAKPGHGFKIALNILNAGRIKLAAGSLGAAKRLLSHALKHAKERKQFGKAICEFGAIKYKIAEIFARSYALESATYRAAHDIEQYASRSKSAKDAQEAEGVKAFAIECAILKVFGSEILDYVVDETVQIFGGMGFSEDTPIARAYRDARVTRIYEGTNEINRMLLVGLLLKKALRGELPLEKAALNVLEDLKKPPTLNTSPNPDSLDYEFQIIESLKKAILLLAGRCVQLFQQDISKEQELLMQLADMISYVYLSESALLRGQKHQQDLNQKAVRVYLSQAVQRIQYGSSEILSYLPISKDEKRILTAGIKRLIRYEMPDVFSLRREIADELVQHESYLPQSY
ncbi:MAG: acyl-CoA dehydrogenase family protein [Cytophagales bacterium]|nr:acyl-CoA dehydrogenase family protein [Cytophagales bacterium]